MEATNIREDASKLMMDAMALSARLSDAERRLGQALGSAGDSFETFADAVLALKEKCVTLTGQIAELSARHGDYAEGSDLVSGAMAAAALNGTPGQKRSYLLKRGWKDNKVGGYEFGELGFMTIDSAMNIQTRKDSEAFKPLLK